MCGIVGYTGFRDAAPVIVEGLRRLEYRGYDSVGIATVGDGLEVCKKKGRIAECEDTARNLAGRTGIGHTRWATHGEPSDVNAHPHLDCRGRVAIVHNGIIENHAELRHELRQRGHRFRSGTDTEVIVHLLEEKEDVPLVTAVQEITPRLQGSFAILAIREGWEEIVAARKGSPLVVGIGDQEVIAASDMTPVLEYTRQAVFLEDGDVSVLTPRGVKFFHDGAEVSRDACDIDWTIGDVRKGGYRHFMEKEIYETPQVFSESVKAVREVEVPPFMADCREIGVVACGTSYHAGLIFRSLMEEICGVPVRVELASEYKYYPVPIAGPVIGISQSGETADTIAAIQVAKAHNLPTLAIVNVLGSTLTRVADATLFMRAGPEISVAATKSFVAELGVLLQVVSARAGGRFDTALDHATRSIEEVLLLQIDAAVSLCQRAEHIFYVGRGPFFPVALEGALKMKEISYIHAEGYAAGEIKHGPFALLSPETPVIALCTHGPSHSVMSSNISEMKARGTPLVVIGDCEDLCVENIADVYIPLPRAEPAVQVVTASVLLQYLAYLTADALGRDVDRPRNLAKSVTVE